MKQKHLFAAAAILVLLAGVGWALFSGEDPEVTEAKQMRDEMLQNFEKMSSDERRAQRDAFRDKMQDFSEEQRREVGRGFRQFMMQRVDRLLAMPEEEQRAELDQWIDRMEEMRKNREQRGDRRGDRGQNRSAAERDEMRKRGLDRSTPDMRAKMDAMRDLLNQRRQERGMDPLPAGAGRGFLGGGRR